MTDHQVITRTVHWNGKSWRKEEKDADRSCILKEKDERGWRRGCESRRWEVCRRGRHEKVVRCGQARPKTHHGSSILP